MRLIDADALKRKKVRSDERCEWVVPVAEIDWMPTIEPGRKTGKWIHGRELSREMIGDCIIAIRYDGWKCSECDCLVEEKREPLYKFCPNCGAKMEVEDAETNF